MCRSQHTTTELLKGYREGSVRAHDDLMAHSCSRLRYVARRIIREDFSRLRRWEETDDLVQSTLLRLNRTLRACPAMASAHFWNLATILIRRELTDLARHHFGPEGQGANHHTDHEGPADRPDPRSMRKGICNAEANEERNSLHEQVEALPEELKEVVGLIWNDGLTQQQAADALGVSLKTIKRRKHGALLLLAYALKTRAAD